MDDIANELPALATDVVPGIGALNEHEWGHVVSAMALSPRQARVVRLILDSKADKQIAREIGVSFGSVRAHLSRIFERTGTSGRMELATLVFTRLMELRDRAKREEGRQQC